MFIIKKLPLIAVAAHGKKGVAPFCKGRRAAVSPVCTKVLKMPHFYAVTMADSRNGPKNEFIVICLFLYRQTCYNSRKNRTYRLFFGLFPVFLQDEQSGYQRGRSNPRYT